MTQRTRHKNTFTAAEGVLVLLGEMFLRKSTPRIGRRIVVGVEALVVARADVDVDVTSVVAVDIVVAVDCATCRGGSTVITIYTAQIKEKSRTCTAEWTSGTVTSGCSIVLGTAVANKCG